MGSSVGPQDLGQGSGVRGETRTRNTNRQAFGRDYGQVAFSELCGFTPWQWEATKLAEIYRFILVGGARGPGKSRWLRWYELRYQLIKAAEGFKGLVTGLFCEDYPSLKDRQISKIEVEFPKFLGTICTSLDQGLGFKLHDRYGGGIIALRNLDDPSKYKSTEFALVGIDELTQNKSINIFNTLRGSNRWPGIERPQFIAASNPDGPGQTWVRQIWIEKNFPDEMKELAKEFTFLQGFPKDNPYLPTSYESDLNSLPERLKRAWLFGDWYITNEGLVYKDFGIGNLKEDPPDPDLPIEIAFDDGYIDPRAILFIQRTGTEIYVYDEIYHSRHLAETCVSEVIERCAAQFGWTDDTQIMPVKIPEIAVGSPEAKEIEKRLRMVNIPVRSKPQRIVPGIDNLRTLICDNNQIHSLKVNPIRCPNLVRELTEGYIYSEGATGSKAEVPIDQNNHACDALRYWAFIRAHR